MQKLLKSRFLYYGSISKHEQSWSVIVFVMVETRLKSDFRQKAPEKRERGTQPSHKLDCYEQSTSERSTK